MKKTFQPLTFILLFALASFTLFASDSLSSVCRKNTLTSVDGKKITLEQFKGKKVDVGRFKGLGEMNPGQLRETTMDPKTRSLIRITLPHEYQKQVAVKERVEQLMGKSPEARFRFIQEHATTVDEEAIDA